MFFLSFRAYIQKGNGVKTEKEVLFESVCKLGSYGFISEDEHIFSPNTRLSENFLANVAKEWEKETTHYSQKDYGETREITIEFSDADHKEDDDNSKENCFEDVFGFFPEGEVSLVELKENKGEEKHERKPENGGKITVLEIKRGQIFKEKLCDVFSQEDSKSQRNKIACSINQNQGKELEGFLDVFHSHSFCME